MLGVILVQELLKYVEEPSVTLSIDLSSSLKAASRSIPVEEDIAPTVAQITEALDTYSQDRQTAREKDWNAELGLESAIWTQLVQSNAEKAAAELETRLQGVLENLLLASDQHTTATDGSGHYEALVFQMLRLLRFDAEDDYGGGDEDSKTSNELQSKLSSVKRAFEELQIL